MKEIEDNLTIVENELEDFLQKHPILVAALPEIKRTILQHFEKAIFEESFRNDVEEDYSTLILNIYTNLDHKTSFQKQKELFSDAFFVEVIKNPAVIYFLTFDFQNK